MAFQFELKEPVSDAVQRVVKREIAGAQKQLRSHGHDDEAVHEVRKSLKKLRAVLRLVRDNLGDAVYHRENLAFRDAARPLTEVRDAAVLVETMHALIEDGTAPIEPQTFDKVQGALLQRQRAITERVLTKGGAFSKVSKVIAGALARLPDWTIQEDGWLALEGGLKRVYREGHRALAACTVEPTVENLHEWRKQAKYLWHQLQLVEPAWIAGEKDLGDQAHHLTKLLGDDHDLAVLRQLVMADPLVFGGQFVVKSLITLIDRQRRALQEKAFGVGRQVYRDSPKLFTARIEGYWKTWRSEVVGARPPGQSQLPPARPTAAGPG